jgi:hypothetical protein
MWEHRAPLFVLSSSCPVDSTLYVRRTQQEMRGMGRGCQWSVCLGEFMNLRGTIELENDYTEIYRRGCRILEGVGSRAEGVSKGGDDLLLLARGDAVEERKGEGAAGDGFCDG